MSRADEAVQQFLGPFNCTQSVLAVYAAEHGLDPGLARRLACPFGAGFAHGGGMCGVVSGGLLVIGLVHGQGEADDQAAKARANAVAQEFVEVFRDRAGDVSCRVLLGRDLTDPVELARAREEDRFALRCAPLVRLGVEILEDIL